DISICDNSSHSACYNVVDIDAQIRGDSDAYVVEHVSYVEALSMLQELWQEIDESKALSQKQA
ncbi:MAG TPA: hypothetical protein VFB12_25170, partial [Ktedonobacteraceae bacterium]|nr:hypothetical protein [Ktedonobacteraceae bacterium]